MRDDDGKHQGAISLEALRVEHADEMWLVLADEALYEFTGGEPPSRDALAARYRSQVGGSGRPEELWCNWIVRRTDNGDAIGLVQATIIDGAADIAWLVGLRHQGQGFGERAVRAMIAELESAGTTSYSAHIHPDHGRSQRLASAVGLARTDAVDHEGEEIWRTPTVSHHPDVSVREDSDRALAAPIRPRTGLIDQT